MNISSNANVILALMLMIAVLLYLSQKGRDTLNADYRRIFDGIPTPMYIYDKLTLRFLAVNDAAIEQYGYTRQEFLSMTITSIRPPEEVPSLLKFHEMISDNPIDAGCWLHRNKENQPFYVRVYTYNTQFEGQAARQVLIVHIDEKVKAEIIMSEKSAELEQILDSITDGFYTLNSRWEVTFMNKAAEQALCCNREEVTGKNLWDFFPRSLEGKFFTAYKRVMTEKISVQFEELYAQLGIWGAMNVYPTKDGIAVYFVDITEQKKIQEKIYNDRQNLHAIINNTPDLIWSVDKDFNIITGNQAFWQQVERVTGKKEADITKADFKREKIRDLLESYERAFQGEAFRVVRPHEIGGSMRFEELSFNPIRDLYDQTIGVNCLLRDVTERHEYLQKIEKQNERLREIAWAHSHRFRAPVANLLGLAQLCNTDDPHNAEIMKMMKKTAEDLDKVIVEINKLTNDQIS